MAEGEKVIRRALDAGLPAALAAARGEVAAGAGGRRRAGRRPGLRRRPVRPGARSPGTTCTAARSPRCRAGRCRGRATCSPRRRGSRSSRTSTTTPTSARSSARPPGSASTRCCSSPRCADPLYRRSVRVSMGAVFAVPWTRLARWPAGLDALRDAGFTVLALTPDPDATPLGDVPARRRRAARAAARRGGARTLRAGARAGGRAGAHPDGARRRLAQRRRGRRGRVLRADGDADSGSGDAAQSRR